jgi:hypothetical protein
MVRAFNGSDTDLQGEEYTGTKKNRAQREKSAAITSAAARMLRERELSDEATKRPMYIR